MKDMATTQKRKTLGRRKIEIKKLEKKTTKQVTFSKRRAGLFKKAGELSVLCGAEVAVVVFSPNDKVFCFGHPNVETLLDRFLSGNDSSSPPKPAECYLPVAEYNREFAEAVRELEVEKKKNKKRAVEEEEIGTTAENSRFWWDRPMETMGVEELKRFRSALMDLRGKVAERVEKMRGYPPIIPAAVPPSPPPSLGGAPPIIPSLPPSSFDIADYCYPAASTEDIGGFELSLDYGFFGLQ